MRPNNNVNKNRKTSIDVAPTTSATFYPTPNFQFTVIFLQFPIQLRPVCAVTGFPISLSLFIQKGTLFIL